MVLGSFFDIFKPIHDAWDYVFFRPVDAGLGWFYGFFLHLPALESFGPYAASVVALTLLIKVLVAPLAQWQLVSSRRTMIKMRGVAPLMEEIKKKHKNDPQGLMDAQRKLYEEHNISPLGQVSGCVPALIQYPLLISLYWVFREAADHHTFRLSNFYFIDLNVTPLHLTYPGTPIPRLEYLILPLLSMGTTFISSKMMQPPANPVATEQEQAAAQTQKTMLYMMPLMFGYFMLISPTGLGLYWFISQLFTMVQQYFVTGLGGLRPSPMEVSGGLGGGSLGRTSSLTRTRGSGAMPSVGARVTAPASASAPNGRRQNTRKGKRARR